MEDNKRSVSEEGRLDLHFSNLGVFDTGAVDHFVKLVFYNFQTIPAHPLHLSAGFSINGWLAVLRFGARKFRRFSRNGLITALTFIKTAKFGS